MATIAQQIEQKGFEIGRKIGRKEGREIARKEALKIAIEKFYLEIAEKLLSEELGLSENDQIALVERVTGFSKDKLKSLTQSSKKIS